MKLVCVIILTVVVTAYGQSIQGQANRKFGIRPTNNEDQPTTVSSGGATVAAEIVAGENPPKDNQDEDVDYQQGINAQNQPNPTNSPTQTSNGNAQGSGQASGSIETPDLGGFFNGIAKGAAQFVEGFTQPLQAIGNTICFGANNAVLQLIRFGDFVGKTFSVSIDGKVIYTGKVGPNGQPTGNNQRHHHGDKRELKEYFESLKNDKGGDKENDKGEYGKGDKGGENCGHGGHGGHGGKAWNKHGDEKHAHKKHTHEGQ